MPRRVKSAWQAFRDFMDSPTENSITRFAWFIVGLIAASLVALNWYAISTLAARDWCGQIMATEKYLGPDGRLSSSDNITLIIEACSDTGLTQLAAIAWVAKALAVALGLIPAAVFVVKFSGASASGSVAGAELRLGPGDSAVKHAAHQAAEQVFEAAEEQAALYPEPEFPPADDERI